MAGKRTITLEQPGLLTMARASASSEFKCRKIAREGKLLFILASFASVIGFGAWAANTQLTSVTRAAGTVVPPSRNQIVQHLEGGIISQIMVREGDRVERGDPLLRLEDRRWTAALAQTRIELETKSVQRARLQAEADGDETFDPPLLEYSGNAPTTERQLFKRRRATLQERAAIYDDQIRRFTLQLAELNARRKNLSDERVLVAERVSSLRRLAAKKAVSRNELLSALTTLQQLETKIADARNQLPQVEAELDETRKRQGEIFTAAQADSAALLADLDLELAKLEENITTMRDREVRSDLRSPVSGVVNKLLVNTVGGIVAPGQEVAEIVPDSEALVVSARLAPNDRGKVWVGMPAILKVTAYDYSIHGGLQAEIAEISPDVVQDENGASFFRVRLTADESDFGSKYPILPGMVADVDMLAQEKTVLQTLVEPLTDLRDTALRE